MNNRMNCYLAYVPRGEPWRVISFLLSIVLVYSLTLWSGLASGIGFFLRYDSVVIPIGVAIIFCVMAHRRTSNVLLFLIFLMTALCGLVLSGVWGSGVSDNFLLAGFLPYSDSFCYVDGSVGLIETGKLSIFASRRPLCAGIYAILLYVCQGHLRLMLSVIVFLTAMAIVLPVRAIIRTHGWLAGYLMFIGAFFFYRRFIGTAMSEHLGLLLGSFGFSLLLRSQVNTRLLLSALGGIFLIALALFARAGAFFVLPFLAVWVGYMWRGIGRRFSFKHCLYAFLAIALGFAINTSVLHAVGRPRASMSNFAHTLYGLLHGGNWSQVYDDHPEVKELSKVEMSDRIYDLSMKRLMEQPFSLISGCVRAHWNYFFSLKGAYSFVLFSLERTAARQEPSSLSDPNPSLWQKIRDQPGRFYRLGVSSFWLFILSCLAVVGVGVVLKKNKNTDSGLFVFAGLGILASVPFVPPWDADLMRAYAATVPFMLAFTAFGAAAIADRFCRTLNSGIRRDIVLKDDWVLVASLIVITLICLSPIAFWTRAYNNRMVPNQADQKGLTMLRFLPGSEVCISDSKQRRWWGKDIESCDVLANMGVLRSGYPRRSAELAALVTSGSICLVLGYEVGDGQLQYLVLDDMCFEQTVHDSAPFYTEPIIREGATVFSRVRLVSPGGEADRMGL